MNHIVTNNPADMDQERYVYIPDASSTTTPPSSSLPVIHTPTAATGESSSSAAIQGAAATATELKTTETGEQSVTDNNHNNNNNNNNKESYYYDNEKIHMHPPPPHNENDGDYDGDDAMRMPVNNSHNNNNSMMQKPREFFRCLLIFFIPITSLLNVIALLVSLCCGEWFWSRCASRYDPLAYSHPAVSYGLNMDKIAPSVVYYNCEERTEMFEEFDTAHVVGNVFTIVALVCLLAGLILSIRFALKITRNCSFLNLQWINVMVIFFLIATLLYLGAMVTVPASFYYNFDDVHPGWVLWVALLSFGLLLLQGLLLAFNNYRLKALVYMLNQKLAQESLARLNNSNTSVNDHSQEDHVYYNQEEEPEYECNYYFANDAKKKNTPDEDKKTINATKQHSPSPSSIYNEPLQGQQNSSTGNRSLYSHTYDLPVATAGAGGVQVASRGGGEYYEPPMEEGLAASRVTAGELYENVYDNPAGNK
eukprot:Nk52_evm1s1352 gene=Nk52_evmTU1s1352